VLPGHAVAVALPGEVAVLVDAPHLRPSEVVGPRRREGREPLLREPLEGALARRAVEAHVRHRVEPETRIPIRLLRADPVVLVRQHERVGEVLHRALDFALRLGTPWLAELQFQPVVAQEVQEARVQLGVRHRLAAHQNDRLRVVEEQRAGPAAEILEGQREPVEQFGEHHAVGEVHETGTRPAQDGAEAVELAPVRQAEELAPVDLRLLPGRGLVADRQLLEALSLGADRPDEILDQRDLARIAAGADLP
jgi:hypothetical protein